MLVTYGSWGNSSLLLFYFNVALCYVSDDIKRFWKENKRVNIKADGNLFLIPEYIIELNFLELPLRERFLPKILSIKYKTKNRKTKNGPTTDLINSN